MPTHVLIEKRRQKASRHLRTDTFSFDATPNTGPANTPFVWLRGPIVAQIRVISAGSLRSSIAKHQATSLNGIRCNSINPRGYFPPIGRLTVNYPFTRVFTHSMHRGQALDEQAKETGSIPDLTLGPSTARPSMGRMRRGEAETLTYTEDERRPTAG